MPKRSKHPTATLVHLGRLRVTLLNGQADWREYVVWQLGLLAAALSLLAVLLLLWRPEAITELEALYVLLAVLPGIAMATILLWWLIGRGYSRSKRFALAFLILGAITASLSALRMFGAVSESTWFDLLLIGTTAYLLGTGVIGLIIFIRGDDVSPWWKR
jgi:hypothetical protein